MSFIKHSTTLPGPVPHARYKLDFVLGYPDPPKKDGNPAAAVAAAVISKVLGGGTKRSKDLPMPSGIYRVASLS